MNAIKTIQDEKLVQLKEHINNMKPGDAISVAYIQRKIRVGYDMGKRLLRILIEDGKVESYKGWVGTSINGVRKDGHEITLYRIPIKEEQ